MLRINELRLSLDADEKELLREAAKALRIKESEIASLSVFRRSVDSRHKNNIHFVYTADIELKENEEAVLRHCDGRVSRAEYFNYSPPEIRRSSKFRPVIAGFGPAGMFCALTLARAGLKPLVIERGSDADTRQKEVAAFFKSGRLNCESNVQFGEGGAGTFSDGKLTTGIKDARKQLIFRELARFGAPKEILFSATPHIGTDRLPEIVKNIRKETEALGGEVKFGCKLTGLILANNCLHGVSVLDREVASFDIETDCLVLAIGHSARDTFEMLYGNNIRLLQKPFSAGFRIEHPREYIDRLRYGSFAGHKTLGAASYKLACHGEHCRGAYSFCMCPGGTVVSASSEEGGCVVNGMSSYARDAENSNSAILAGIEPKDLKSSHPLEGMFLQREIEKAAFNLAGGSYAAPAQRLCDFLSGRESKSFGAVKPSCPTGAVPCDISPLFPERLTEGLRSSIPLMDKKLRGFALPDAVLTAPETRSSSPVRILRDEFFQCFVGDSFLGGVYPCGEGAGYAGGIVSAAVDGLRCAEAILLDGRNYNY